MAKQAGESKKVPVTISITQFQKDILTAWAASGVYGTTTVAETASLLVGDAIRSRIDTDKMSDPTYMAEYRQKVLSVVNQTSSGNTSR